MRDRGTLRRLRLGHVVRVGLLCGLLCLFAASAAEAAGISYQFDATLSLTGGCGTSKADPIPDPGCPDKKPPKGFTTPTAIAIDSAGDEYVASFGAQEGLQGRIDVFSAAGVFITEVKDEFGPRSIAVDSKGVLYTFDQSPGHPAEFARYRPILYKPAEEKIEYGAREVIATDPNRSNGGIAVDANDNVFVDWGVAIGEYSSSEAGNDLLATITDPRLYSSTFIALDRDRRRLYASSCPNADITECWVLVFNADAPHELLEEVERPNPPSGEFVSQKGWISIAVDEETGDFFVGDLELSKNIYQFNGDYEYLSTLALNPELFEGGEALQIAISNASGASNYRYLFVPSLRNRALAYRPSGIDLPVIETISVANIGETEAELKAQVEPSGGSTHYEFQYITQQAYEEGGNSFAAGTNGGEGTISPNEQRAEISAALTGLTPGTQYRFRVVAENAAGNDEEEGTFVTYADAPTSDNCPNQSLRIGASAFLPDCRAFELVTPTDTNGQRPTGTIAPGDIFPAAKVSPTGNVITFLTRGGAIPGLGGNGSFNGDPYRTFRTDNGWLTESIGPTGAETTSTNPGSNSPDQGYSFWVATREGSAATEGEAHYVRYPDGHSALVGRGSLGDERLAVGRLITENGSHIVFETQNINGHQAVRLEPEAPPTGTEAVYDRTADEITHVVSLLPGNVTPASGQDAESLGASADGAGIAFSIGSKLYLRVDNSETFEIGDGVTFAGVAEGGSRIFYVKEGNLFAFDTEANEAIPFTTTGNVVVVNVAPDGTRAYFVSTSAIAGSGPNPNGAKPKVGQRNLYLSEEGTIRFVATVTARDVDGESNSAGQVDGLGLWTSAVLGSVAIDPSRVNPDGSVLLFQSRANLDSYDSDGAPQVYRYDSAGGRLHCISCLPTGLPSSGGGSLESYVGFGDELPALSQSGLVRNLRADGRRAFFQSVDALVLGDTDEVQDVYEWEDQGIGSCTRPGGCVYLISSGQSKGPDYLYGASDSGDDVFFVTSDVLVPGDDDTPSIYDARVNGGFPVQVSPNCEGDSCHSPLGAGPSLASPVTEAAGKSGNVAKRCPKGKRKVVRRGKKVCVKKHRHRRSHHNKKGAGK
jgi:hypothetical protein